jgi:hypothetical protein
MKTVVQKMTPGDVPFPWSEKDPFRLPVSIDRVQKMLITLGECGAHSAAMCSSRCCNSSSCVLQFRSTYQSILSKHA